MRDIVEIEGISVDLGPDLEHQIISYLKKNKYVFAMALNKKYNVPVSTALYTLRNLADKGVLKDLGIKKAVVRGVNRGVRVFTLP